MPKLKPEDVRFLTFQGGGGKGGVYGGPIALFEQLGHLPAVRRKSDGERLHPPVVGISGSSAGAITAFTLALGMKLEDLNRAMDEKHFGRFFELPVPGMYKAVKFIRGYKNEKLGIPEGDWNVPGYAVDLLINGEKLKTVHPQKGKVLVKKQKMAKVTRFYDNLEDAKEAARKNYRKYLRHTHIAEWALLAIGDTAKKQLDNISDFLDLFRKTYESIPTKLETNLKNHPIPFLMSIKYDRGLLTGIETREYFCELLTIALHNLGNLDDSKMDDKIFQKSPEEVLPFKLDSRTARFVTFKQLHTITGVHLVIQGVNIVNPFACVYSHESTPDFPVVDAVCASMSIPFAFKPTLSDCKVDFSLDEKDPVDLNNLLRYNGYIVDGGLLNNLPIHAFNHFSKNGSPKEPLQKMEENLLHPLNEGVLSFALREGYRLKESVPQDIQRKVPEDLNRDENFKSWLKKQNDLEKEKINNWRKQADKVVSFDALTASTQGISGAIPEVEMFDALKVLPTALWEGWEFDRGGGGGSNSAIGATKNWFQIPLNPWLGSMGHFFGNIFGTIMYGTQDQRLRSNAEREQLVELFSYAVGIFDFEPDPDLRKFVQVRGAVQLYGYFRSGYSDYSISLKKDKPPDYTTELMGIPDQKKELKNLFLESVRKLRQ